MTKVLKKFGKYLLLDRLAQGGMAEIFRAWAPSVDGGGRLIALKCVQQGLGEDLEFLQMFRSEIRVTMGLNHPNIVQLYDFGEFESRPYIAMELVEGKNLKQFTGRVFQKGQLMQPEFAAHLILQAAAGLHYAHSYKDQSTGEPLNIVHRDISPQNLLLSYGGNLKIIDFGIAKAAGNRQATRAGVIKGKPSYLSPEQIDGTELDGRSDIFSLGGVLWETLTGRKLFSGDSELAAVRMIEDCDQTVKPPSTLNRYVPSQLDAIVMKALAKDRNRRFTNAEEMQRALHRFIYSYRPDFDPAEFASYLQDLFKGEMEQEQETIRALSLEAKELFVEESLAWAAEEEAQKNPAPRRREKPKTFTSLSLESVEIDVNHRQATQRSAAAPRAGSKAKKQGGGSGLGKFIAMAAAAGLIIYLLPSLSAISHRLLKLRTHSSEEVSDTQDNATSASSNDSSGTNSNPPVRDVAARAPVAVRLHVYPTGGAIGVYLDQKPVNPNSLDLPVGSHATLEVVANGFKPFIKSITATAANDSIVVDAVLEPQSFGTLSLHTTPTAEAKISMNNLVWVQNTPLEQLKLPPGTYRIQLTNQLLGLQKNLDVTIAAGRDVDQDVNLDVIK